LGLLPYINDLASFFERLAATQPGKFILFSYGFDRRTVGKTRGLRNRINTLDEALAFFSRYVDNLTVLFAIREEGKRFLFSGTLGPAADKKMSQKKQSLSDLIPCTKQSKLANVFRHIGF